MSEAATLDTLRKSALDIFSRALAACDLTRAMLDRLHLDPERRTLQISGDSDLDLRDVQTLVVIAAGKGALPMLTSLLALLRPLPDLAVEGLLIAPSRPAVLPENVQYIGGGHPLPNQASLDAGQAALELLQRHAANPASARHVFCLFLISGGSSAMMELPLEHTIPLADVLAFHSALIGSGATIHEINCIRKHFSAVKGGRLALAAGAMRSAALLVSDVPAQHLDALGSGPTCPDTSTVAQCRTILDKYDLLAHFPASVRSFFCSSTLPETPKANEVSCRNYLLLSSEDLAAAAQSRATSLGFHSVIERRCDDWDYRDSAQYLLNRLREERRHARWTCLLAPGEVTVALPHGETATGKGGRNQHFALYAATLLEPGEGPIVVLSAGSDGVDGNSAAAGAVVCTGLLGREDSPLRHAAHDALRLFNSAPLLQELGASVITGPTSNNLRDLRILLAFNGSPHSAAEPD